MRAVTYEIRRPKKKKEEETTAAKYAPFGIAMPCGLIKTRKMREKRLSRMTLEAAVQRFVDVRCRRQ